MAAPLSACAQDTGSSGQAPAAALDVSDDPTFDLYPLERNARYQVQRDLTRKALALTYNNYYEFLERFGSVKDIWEAAQNLEIRPWSVRIEGMVEEAKTVDIDTLIRAMPLEERIYRHRCVEAWAMTVPWSGFPMKALLDYAKPLGGAKYVKMQTFFDQDVAPNQSRSAGLPWPYTEGLTIEEAANELAFMATGLYGKPLTEQNGAPLRLVVPWKYGFKSLKSIDRIVFTDERPLGFWEELQPSEYGFWANINPDVPHPRWSQSTERLLGEDEQVPTRLYNGYEEYVAGLYRDKAGEDLFR